MSETLNQKIRLALGDKELKLIVAADQILRLEQDIIRLNAEKDIYKKRAEKAEELLQRVASEIGESGGDDNH